MSEAWRQKPLSLEEKRELLGLLLRKEIERTPPGSDERVEWHRRQFPALDGKAYFNYGAHGTMPRPAIDAVIQSYEHVQRWGPFSTEINEWVEREIDRTAACLAAQIGAPPENVALTENATVGCGIVLWGLDWRAGDHILLSDCENPGIVAAVRTLARRLHLEVSTCAVSRAPGRGSLLDAVASGLRANTRLVVLSHILWNTGQVLPLGEVADLCRARGRAAGPVRLLADGAQSVGVLPLKVAEAGVDFYAFTGHKWLCGPEGVGGLYVSPEAVEELQPAFAGWRGVTVDKADGSLGWRKGARRFEVSTSAYPLFAGLRCAVDIHDGLDSAAGRYERILKLSRSLWEKLRAAGEAGQTAAIECLQTSPPESGIVVVRLNGHDHQRAVYFLEAEGCYGRAMYDPECLRFCLHYFTTQAEVDRLVELLRHYVGRGRRATHAPAAHA